MSGCSLLTILNVPELQIPFVLEHKGEKCNAFPGSALLCSGLVSDPTLCMQNLLLGVLNVCAASSSQGLQSGTYGVSHFLRASSIWAAGYGTFPSTACQLIPPSRVSSRSTLQMMETGMLRFGSGSAGGGSCPSFHPQRQPPDHLLFFMCWGRRGAGREISLKTFAIGNGWVSH